MTHSTRPAGNVEALQAATKLHEIHELIHAEILYSQAKLQKDSDRSRSTAPIYHVRDKVWLNARNITTRRPSVKLDHKRLGPFPVIALIEKYACHLELPVTMKVHNVFHVCLLEPAASDPFPG